MVPHVVALIIAASNPIPCRRIQKARRTLPRTSGRVHRPLAFAALHHGRFPCHVLRELSNFCCLPGRAGGSPKELEENSRRAKLIFLPPAQSFWVSPCRGGDPQGLTMHILTARHAGRQELEVKPRGVGLFIFPSSVISWCLRVLVVTLRRRRMHHYKGKIRFFSPWLSYFLVPLCLGVTLNALERF
jgi:hypothetical protein